MVSPTPHHWSVPHINSQSFPISSVGPLTSMLSLPLIITSIGPPTSMLSPSPRHQAVPLTYYRSFLLLINCQYFITSSVGPPTSSFSPPTSVSPSPLYQLVLTHQQSVPPHQSFSHQRSVLPPHLRLVLPISYVSLFTSRISPSPHQWSVHPHQCSVLPLITRQSLLSMVIYSPHQWSVFPQIISWSNHIIVQSRNISQSFPGSSVGPSTSTVRPPTSMVGPPTYMLSPSPQHQVVPLINGHSFPTSMVSISSHHQLVQPHHRSVHQHQSVLPHIISWLSHINSQSPHINGSSPPNQWSVHPRLGELIVL